MASLNRIQLIGNVGKDPESSYTPSGKMVTKFTLAVSNTWKTGDEKKTETEWFNLEAWDGIAKTISQYVKKGSKLYVEGRIKTDKFEGKDGSGTKYFTKVVVSNIQFLGDNNRDTSQQVEQEQSSAETPDEGDIPF